MVTLRDVTAADLPVLCEQQRDPQANRLAAVKARAWSDFEQHWDKILADAAIRKKAIVFNGHLAGHLVCFERGGVREVGYWLGRSYRGKGVASRALALFLAGVPERPLHARVTRDNVASICVLEKCGFKRVGLNVIPAHEGWPTVEEVLMDLEEVR